MSESIKTCRTCGAEKAVAEFSIGSWRKDGKPHYRLDCQQCCTIKRLEKAATPEYRERAARNVRAYRDRHPDRVKEQNARTNAAGAERQARWAKKNRARINAAARRRYADNPKAAYEKWKRWAAANPEAVRAKEAKHRLARLAVIQSSPSHYTAAHLKSQLVSQRGLCYWCQKPLEEVYHVDHIFALSRGGTNGPENICCACPGCNLKKGPREPMEFAGRLF